MQQSYDPIQRPWFRLAMTDSDKTFLGAPYLDAWGMGYVMTVSRAARYKGGEIAGILGSDYFLKQIGDLFKTTLNCGDYQSENECLLVDETGAVIWWEKFRTQPKYINLKFRRGNGKYETGPMTLDEIDIEPGVSVAYYLTKNMNVGVMKCHDAIQLDESDAGSQTGFLQKF